VRLAEHNNKKRMSGSHDNYRKDGWKQFPGKELILLLLSVAIATGFQPENYTLLKSLPSSPSFFTTDNLGNCYVIENNQLTKYDNNGKTLSTYSNKDFGTLKYADASNPLHLLLFYPDFLQVVYLDKTLSSKGVSIPLDTYGMDQAILVCASYDNGFWAYDSREFSLKKIDSQFLQKYNSGNIRQSTGKDINPTFLIEWDKQVYLNDPKLGIFVFDSFGAYVKTIPLTGIASFQFIGEELIYFKDGKLKSFHLKTLAEKNILLPGDGKDATNARIEQRRCYMQTKSALNFYSY
jgi:hypothetical protein